MVLITGNLPKWLVGLRLVPFSERPNRGSSRWPRIIRIFQPGVSEMRDPNQSIWLPMLSVEHPRGSKVGMSRCCGG